MQCASERPVLHTGRSLCDSEDGYWELDARMQASTLQGRWNKLLPLLSALRITAYCLCSLLYGVFNSQSWSTRDIYVSWAD